MNRVDRAAGGDRQPPSARDEEARIAAVADYWSAGSDPDAEFDHVVQLAASLFGVATALVSLVGRDEQTFVARAGLDICGTSREVSFCAHALDRDDPMVIEDALLDPRFAANPLVLGAPHIRFYAGMPLRVTSGAVLGTLCLINPAPRTLDAHQRHLLASLAQIVVDRLELRRSQRRYRASEQRLSRLAHVDQLTGLANRAQLHERANEILARDGQAALLLFDLDGFKFVNDVFGHATGDRLLCAVADRLRSLLDERHLLARLGGDEFVILLIGVSDAREAYGIAEDLRRSFRKGFLVEDQDLQLETCVGLALAPYHGDNVETLLRHADLALYRAKEEGGAAVGYFEPHLRHSVEKRRGIQSELHQAFQRGEFELHYQPQVRLADGELIGAEALLRWRHPARGLLSPGEFLGILELMPLSARVGEWVLCEAIRQAAAWAAAGSPLRVAVNLSAAQFLSGSLADLVTEHLARFEVPAQLLELEMTERLAVKNVPSTAAILSAVRETGVGVALDDFGTGFASLSLLNDLPVSKLKIDRAFTAQLGVGVRSAALVEAILRLGRAFDLEVVAEGVETAEQAEWLRAAGCDEAQGYFYGRPMTAERLNDLL
ncbi:putative bifunctional diguanylate cyclase/phosphodiesterase [Sphingomonas sp. ac-8]|uniref:putative bifunctional diguanylate cyclase/phosphodiesterase n=1 Tax=Sphingomonas sp. ac-8 TaxID=3242977 RepID=UPI003A8071BF